MLIDKNTVVHQKIVTRNSHNFDKNTVVHQKIVTRNSHNFDRNGDRGKSAI